MRPVALRRSWLFVGAADTEAIAASNNSAADACIQEFEDFCVPELREQARQMMADVLADWRARNKVASVRINPLEDEDGLKDLYAAMKYGAQAILIPKANRPEQIVRLARHINELEAEFGRPAGSTEIIPNIEQAQGLEHAYQILTSHSQITASLVASEDMCVSLHAPRQQKGGILDYVRERFHIACCAANITSIDMPYTWIDDEGVTQQTMLARSLGMTSKSTVNAKHCQIINTLFSPSDDEIEQAEQIISAFETARARGEGQVICNGIKVEVPSYLNAQQILLRAKALRLAEEG